MPSLIRPRGDPPPQYGPLEERFSVEINHGLRIIASDSDTIMMTAVVPKFQLFRLYVTEKDFFDGLELDDICILGSPDLPAVFSPKHPSKQARTSGVKPGSDDDDDSNYGDEFVDSDNEIDRDDDDIFEEWVDHESTEKKKGTEWIDDDYDSDYLDINNNECECGSWQLRGIPCRHACSVFRHERIKPETRVCQSYSIHAFKQAYATGILPCRDKRAWQKMDAIPVKPPLYEKIVGRPSKKRRKSALELQDGARMSKHGSISHCSLCNSTEHNKRKCPNRGMQGQALGDEAHAPAHAPTKRKLPVRRKMEMVDTQESAASIDECIANSSQTTVQQALILQSQASQQSRVLMPIPESSFLARSKLALPLPSSNLLSTKQTKKRGPKPKK